MSEHIIQLDGSKCKACYACIRVCPVKAIHIPKDSVFPQIVEDLCINCGICLNSCVYNAITYQNTIEEVKLLLNSKEKVSAICAPSIAEEFDDIADYRKFVAMLRTLGFTYVNEMSFGVDLVARKFKMLTEEHFNGKYFLNSSCPSIVSLIEKFYPDLIGNLVPCISPAAATALAVRKLYGNNIKTVLITPCIAAKEEKSRNQGLSKIDVVITFQELRSLFDEFNIKETFIEFSDFDEPLGYKGRLYPISDGFIEAAGLDLGLIHGKSITAEGKDNSIAAVEQFLKYNEIIKRNINLFFCEGCIMGRGTSKFGKKYLRHVLVVDYIKKRLKDFDVAKWEKNMNAIFSDNDFEAHFTNKQYKLPYPKELEIKAALNMITQRNNNKEINCGGCGFKTCKRLALAIAQHTAIPEMCVTNAQMGNREVSYTVKKTIEELSIANNELNNARNIITEISDKLKNQTNALSIFVRSLNSGIVFADENLKVIESNMGFIEILGEDAKEIHEIIPYLIGADLKSLIPGSLISQLTYLLSHDENGLSKDVEIDDKLINVGMFQLIPNKLVGAIFRNLHSKEERPEEIIHLVNEVIEENLRQVQQMGFILGEGAAKTEKMLNTIIKSYK